MHTLIVHCHPEPQSFNGSMTRTAVKALEIEGHSVEVSDLYAEGFDPVERREHYQNRRHATHFDILSEQRNAYKTGTLPKDVRREIDRLEKCDLLILQFPLWWHQQPAILKGWFDRVFVGGGLYTSTMRYDKGYFKGKTAICSVTSGAPEATFTANGRGGGRIETLLRPMDFSLHYMGFRVLPPFLSAEIQNKDFSYMSSDRFELHVEKSLARWRQFLKNIDKIEPLAFPGWDDWDGDGCEKSV